MDPRETKARLRLAMKERLSRLNQQAFAAESRTTCKRILENLPAGPLTICAYYPLPDEVDVKAVLDECIKRGDRVFLPSIHDLQLVFRQVTDLSSLKSGALNILEPPKDAPLLQEKDLNVALIPGRAFDIKGQRLGRGNGGYDIWLRHLRSMNRSVKIWGVAFESQMVQDIPMETHDEGVDGVITARGLLNVR